MARRTGQLGLGAAWPETAAKIIAQNLSCPCRAQRLPTVLAGGVSSTHAAATPQHRNGYCLPLLPHVSSFQWKAWAETLMDRACITARAARESGKVSLWHFLPVERKASFVSIRWRIPEM